MRIQNLHCKAVVKNLVAGEYFLNLLGDTWCSYILDYSLSMIELYHFYVHAFSSKELICANATADV
jgi:hypothetical protein